MTTVKGLADRIAERTGSGIPKFNSLPPPSFPISSPSIVSPSSYFAIPHGLSPAELLDSPVLFSDSMILPSPTTGTFPMQAFNWQNNLADKSSQLHSIKDEQDKYSEFSFQAQSKPSTLMNTSWENHQQSGSAGVPTEKANFENDSNSMQSFSPEIATIQTNDQSNSYGVQTEDKQLVHNNRSDDGYNWRKYGQKQVKGSENPRSYYKCTYPNCPKKKKVERSLLDGHITEIVYKGTHNHPKPQSTRRSSSSAMMQAQQNQSNGVMEHYGSNSIGRMDSAVGTPENSSITVGDEDFDQSSRMSRSGGDGYDEEEPDAKRWRGETENEAISAAGRNAVREPRVVVQTKSDIDILDDGYRWRKYGQKVVRGNPNPRSYYKCTSLGCAVRKHVERACHDAGSVITTYEGKHNHDIPAPRGSRSLSRPVPTNAYSTLHASNPSAFPHNMNQPMDNERPTVAAPPSYNNLGMPHNIGSFGYSGYTNPANEARDNMFLGSFLS